MDTTSKGQTRRERPQLANRTIFTEDNLNILRGMNSDSVDLIYLDPPFNSNRNYAAPVGSKAAGAAFKDTWTLEDMDIVQCVTLAENAPNITQFLLSVQGSHSKGMQSYLTMMAVRLVEMRRVLKDTGSIYLHCDPTASHYLKQLMDCVFGRENFRNEIVWRIGWVSGYKTQKRGWVRNHDILLYYVASPKAAHRFNKEYIPYPEGYLRRDGKPPTGKGIPIEDTWNCQPVDTLDSIAIKSFSKEKVGYPTQKPLALLDRIIKASTNEGDMVLDPFAGCATACVSAESLKRKWIGIDLSDKAIELVNLRLEVSMGDLFHNRLVTHRTDIPKRTDLGPLPPYKSHKKSLYGEQGGNCIGCGTHFEIQHLTVDHIIPRSKGGTDHIENLQLLCGNCNSVKGNRPQEYLLTRTKKDMMRQLREYGLLMVGTG